MVFFVCEGCNESLKKAQVDSHANRCHSCHAVTCVDCNVTFWGDDYRVHTSCVSEAERYERSVYRGPKKGEKGGTGKKLNPQEAWNDLIQEASSRKEEADASIRGFLDALTSCTNVPRKEKQFKNFTSNSLKIRGQDSKVKLIWDFLCSIRDEKKLLKEKEEAEEQRKKEQVKKEIEAKENDQASMVEEDSNDEGGEVEADAVGVQEQDSTSTKKIKKNKKRKADLEQLSEADEGERTNEGERADDVDAKAVKILAKILKKSENKSMKLKELAESGYAALVKKGLAADFSKGEKDVKKFVKNLLVVADAESKVSNAAAAARKRMKLEGKIVSLQ